MSLSPFSNLNRVLDRRTFVVAAGVACIGLMAKLSSTRAATPTWGTALTKTVSGVTYTYKSGYSMGTTPCAYARITSSKTVAAATMQAQAVVIKETNMNIAAASGWIKCARGTAVQASTKAVALKLGCRSRGRVKIKGVPGMLSCNPIRPRTLSLTPDLPVNENGQTLGTYEDVERGAVPDLIGIVADSGVDGYAYWEQFDAEDAPNVIPVYAEDGATQIGVFSFGDK